MNGVPRTSGVPRTNGVPRTLTLSSPKWGSAYDFIHYGERNTACANGVPRTGKWGSVYS